ncbi:hemin transport protein [Proteus hauseri ATCC 700826]|uniref:Hemin transport protein n=1 Tax=Proteus hauseri ATCC 700826 TaxID=1354271 RepID=A0AAJ3HST7_PROHU|nr:ChuX/HutX family heme-like substrate-binding protein [Proteus hauseri]OAT47218.1 hemin transport protein [Proteus hauseri ATCC 700826]
MNTSLYESYLQAKADKKAPYARDLAAYLNVSEAQLTHARVGHDAKRLRNDVRDLLTALGKVGEVKAITRNDIAVHEHLGEYTNARFNDHAGLILNPHELDLRFFFSYWKSIFSLTEETAKGPRHSIQFFDMHGDALHKVYVTDNTNMDEWEALIQMFLSEENPVLDIIPVEPFTDTPVNDELAQQLDQQWRSMTDVHQFFKLLKEHNLSRQQAFKAVSDDLAYQVDNSALKTLLEQAKEAQNEIMIFVGSRGCVQIFTGTIDRLVPHQFENSDQVWINVFNPAFTLHVIESEIAESWITRKPTQDGFVTSLEIFDNKGQQIAQLYGQRTEGTAEQQQWREQVNTLAKIV